MPKSSRGPPIVGSAATKGDSDDPAHADGGTSPTGRSAGGTANASLLPGAWPGWVALLVAVAALLFALLGDGILLDYFSRPNVQTQSLSPGKTGWVHPEPRSGKGGRPSGKPAVVGEAVAPGPAQARVGKLVEALVTRADLKAPWTRKLLSEEVQRKAHRSEERFPNLREKGDLIQQACYTTAFFREHSIGYSIQTDINVDAYMASCREVWPSIAQDARDRIEKSISTGQLWKNLYQRYSPLPRPTPRQCADNRPAMTEAEMRSELGGDVTEKYLKAGMQPLRLRRKQIKEIRKAFERSEIARFDATQLVPRTMFNISVDRLKEMHPNKAKRGDQIPVNFGQYFHGFHPVCGEPMMKFQELVLEKGPRAEMVQTYMRTFLPWVLEHSGRCAPKMSLEDIVRKTKQFVKHFPYDRMGKYGAEDGAKFEKLRAKNLSLSSHQINVKRLTNYMKDVDFTRALGLDGLVDNLFSYLWLGVSPGEFHWDAEDNVLIQLTGEVDIFLFDANCTYLVEELDRFADITEVVSTSDPKDQFMKGNRARIPFYHMRLRPGDGVVMPSFAKHRIIIRDTRRVGMNVAFLPKFGAMRWPGAPASAFTRFDIDVFAVRSLFMRSVKHLYETRGIVYTHHTARQEII